VLLSAKVRTVVTAVGGIFNINFAIANPEQKLVTKYQDILKLAKQIEIYYLVTSVI
jgi:hypothetical protein